MPRRIIIVTAGHLATCPRMVKAADAFSGIGDDVRVVSVQHTAWARHGDAAIRRTRQWAWDPIDYARSSAPFRWLASGARFRAARTLTRLGPTRVADIATPHAFSRVHSLLVSAILREPGDLIYGGTAGALAAVAEAGRRSGTPFAVDFEDLHCGEDGAARGSDYNAQAERIMRDVVRDAAFVTAGSSAIAAECEARFGRIAVPIHNAFSLPALAPTRSDDNGVVRFYWFSQTIGPSRGLEDVVRAAGMLMLPCELHLRGVSANGYVGRLIAFATATAPSLRVMVHDPAEPDAMVEACAPFDIGLATEQGHTPNNAMALSNKALTYPLAGLPVVLTDTPGQRTFARDLGEGAVTYPAGDSEELASVLHSWMTDRKAREIAGQASWEAARARWHWEHPRERGELVACVERVFA
jgi:glycosyltransferase involved in cell wall biosynthesis